RAVSGAAASGSGRPRGAGEAGEWRDAGQPAVQDDDLSREEPRAVRDDPRDAVRHVVDGTDAPHGRDRGYLGQGRVVVAPESALYVEARRIGDDHAWIHAVHRNATGA